MGTPRLHIMTERRARARHPVWYETTLGQEDAFSLNPDVKLLPLNAAVGRLNYWLSEKTRKVVPDITVPVQAGDWYLFVVMSVFDWVYNRATLRRVKARGGRVCLYCYDTWEPEYGHWLGLLRNLQPDAVFFAYYQSYEFFSASLPHCHFLPQSMDARFFRDYGMPKTRMFMQMGRRVDSIHDMILRYMRERGMEDTPANYSYRRTAGEIPFPDMESMARAVNGTKYFVCAPRRCHAPGFTGNVQDVTARFYEAMACKSLIIGFKPEPVFDMLFPEDAMVTLRPDGADFAEKIDWFENHPEEYRRIVERNYATVMEKHTWQARYEAMRAALDT